MILKRIVAIALAAGQVLLGVPVQAETSAAAPPTVAANRAVPKVDPVPLVPEFSNQPTQEEIFRARVFGEPVMAVGGEPTSVENQALAQALLSFHQGFGATRYAALESFLSTYPESPYRASLLLNLGNTYRLDGYYTRSLIALEQAWNLAKNDNSQHGREVADAAVGELLALNQKFGRHHPMEELVEQVKHRPVVGAATEKVASAIETVDLFKNHHHLAIPSGSTALWRLQVYYGQQVPHAALKAFQATHNGASLAQMDELARTIGLDLTPAYREADAPIPIPSLAHFKVGHFTAVVGQTATHYKLDDFALGGEVWVTKQALADESSGYFLISGAMGPGWRKATQAEIATRRGKCAFWDWLWNGPGEPACDGGCPKGMAFYSFQKTTVALHFTDTPVGYDPPRGPAVRFRMDYSQRDRVQPATFSYSNLGPKWTFDWISFVQDTPANLAAPANVYMRGGQYEQHTAYDGVSTYKANRYTQAVIVRTSINPIRYERRLPDGSVEVYAQSDGATSPRRVFLTQSIDPQGQSVTYTYDASLRLVAVSDAIGQVTSLEYSHSTDPLKIMKVTDPFGRSARMEYDAAGKLIKITDVIGMTSQFEYGVGDFVRSLVTPYGRTNFSGGTQNVGDIYRWLEARDPLGGVERLEFRFGVNPPPIPDSEPVVPIGFGPNSGLRSLNSFYWDKRAMALHPGDVTKAEITKWMWEGHVPSGAGWLSHIPASTKRPLENRVWYVYEGGAGLDQLGPIAKPSKIGRVLDDGTSQITRFEYGEKGQVTRLTDPVGREAIYTYAANGIDLLAIKQKNGGNYDVIQQWTYNSEHKPLTSTDAAGQVTTYTYNANGTTATVVTPVRAGLSIADRTTSYSYNPDNAANGPGRLQTVTQPLGVATGYTYDGYGRIRTTTDSDGYAATYDYDALDRPTKATYPDGTFDERIYNRLDVEKHRDRSGYWTQTFHDALRRPVSTRDEQGRVFTQGWCTCGTLDKLTDANGNTISWERDLQGRMTREVRPNGTDRLFTYENTTSRLKESQDSLSPTRQKIQYEYFLDDNLKKITYVNEVHPTADVQLTYDAAYDRIASRIDGSGTTVFSYHPSGSVGAGMIASIDGPLPNDTITYTFDEVGWSSGRQIDGPANAVSVTHDAIGRITSEASPLGTFSYSFVGIGAGHLGTFTYPNGQSITYDHFDNVGDQRLKEIHNKLSGGQTLSKGQYTYDAQGNVKTWSVQLDTNPAQVITFGYDPSGQVVTAVRNPVDPTLVDRFAYAYDKAGNRIAEQLDDVVTGATYDASNRLTSTQPGGSLRFRGTTNEAASVTVGGNPAVVSASNEFDARVAVGSGTSTVPVVATDAAGNARTNTYQVSQTGSTKTYTYDGNGNLLGDGTRTFEWDAENRLTAIAWGTRRSELAYDGHGRCVRITEKDGAAVLTDKRFVWDGSTLAEERDSTGATVLRRFFAHGLQEGANSFYYTTDHLGSIREMTDSSGSVRARYDYDPYGRRAKLSGDKDSPFGFTGFFVHQDTGLNLALHRAYDATLGRWISEDPIGLAGGINRYSYVSGRTTVAIDPLGLQAIPKTEPTIDLPKRVCRILPWKPPPPQPPVIGPGNILGAVGIVLTNASALGGPGDELEWECQPIPTPTPCPDPQTNKDQKKEKCPPCPPPPPMVIHRSPPSRRHLVDDEGNICPGDHVHIFEYHQSPWPKCKCYLKKKTRCLGKPGAQPGG